VPVIQHSELCIFIITLETGIFDYVCLRKGMVSFICIISINARRRTNILRYLYNFLNVY